MKILFVHPMKRGKERSGGKVSAYMPPLSLSTLAGLTPVGIDVELCDESVDAVNLGTDAQLIGITGMTSQINRGYEIADTFRRQGKKVVMGGIHVSALPEEARKHADSILIGEAEEVWPRMIEDYSNGCMKETYRTDGYPDLNAMVIPRYDLLNLERYRRSTGSRLPRIPIQASRGCPFNCSFCSVTRFWGPRIRTKPLENIEAELSNIRSLGTNRVFFTDDNFVADTAYTSSLLELLRKEGFSWLCQVSTNIQQSEDLIFEMARAGCTAVYVGIETFSKQNLRDMNKQVNARVNYERLFSLFSKVGIRVTASLIVGMDEDTKESLEEMGRELVRLKASSAQFYLPIMLPGTRLREQFLEERRVTEDNWDRQDGTTVTFVPKNFRDGELQAQYWRLFRDFYSLKSICRRVVTLGNLRKGLSFVLIPLRTNLYFRKRIKHGLHPIEN